MHRPQLPIHGHRLSEHPGRLCRYHRSLDEPVTPRDFHGDHDHGSPERRVGPMGTSPEGHQNNKADRFYNSIRWLSPLYTIYKIIWDLLS